MAGLMNEAFKGTEFSGRADLHCYFWPHAAQLLKEGGWFGFLTSAQWLDVDYGFDLQRWILKHFKIVAILESSTERWFPDARVKTCITILQRWNNEQERRDNPVRFVRFEKRLGDIIGVAATGGVGAEAEEKERIRQVAVDRVRDRIERRSSGEHNDDWRLLVKRQGDLWDDGVRARSVLANASIEEDADEEDDGEGATAQSNGRLIKNLEPHRDEYAAGKWGRYLRAPNLYFEILEKYRARFVPLGEVVDIRRGITSGCDAFFMPRDVTDWALENFEDPKEFRDDVGAPRSDVASGMLRVVEDGAGTRHPIEPKFIKPEVHSLMKVRRPIVRAKEQDRVVLLVGSSLAAIKGTHAYRYIKYGEQATYASKKSKAVPVPQRIMCAGRDPWYDLTKLVDPGFAFWPMAQQYRHIIPANPEGLICNQNFFDLASATLNKTEKATLVAILNSTLVGLFKTYYGRFSGTEGNLKTGVMDVNLLELPDPRGVSQPLALRLSDAFKSMCKREVGHMVEEALKECHSFDRALELASRPIVFPDELQQPDRRALDDAVFELVGVMEPSERAALINRLYDETTRHFRAIRVTEIQKMEDRREGSSTKFATADHAADAWDALDLTDLTPLAEWVKNSGTGPSSFVDIPGERPVHLAADAMFDMETVYFGKNQREHIVAPSRGTAELIARLAELGVTGEVSVPNGNAEAMKLLDKVNRRHAIAAKRLQELAYSRSGDTGIREQVFKLLERWYVVGKPTVATAASPQIDWDQKLSSV